mgnify:CR=1 FL=1
MLTPQELVVAYHKKTKKQFGQHFLTSESILSSIANCVDLQEDDYVLEIGPGCGTLTSQLIARAGHVHAIEIDRDAAQFLRGQFVEKGLLTLTEGDALRIDLGEVLSESPRWKCAANLPYNVGTPIFFELTKYRDRFDKLALMFQKEVAERMVATTDDRKDYGVLSLMTHLYHDAYIAMELPPGAFSPPPKVDSALVVLEPIKESRIPDEDLRNLFIRVVKAAFQQRRKTISNSLKSLCKDKELVKQCLSNAGIDLKARAEVVEFDSFVALAKEFQAVL